jgi:hypothetical protein
LLAVCPHFPRLSSRNAIHFLGFSPLAFIAGSNICSLKVVECPLEVVECSLNVVENSQDYAMVNGSPYVTKFYYVLNGTIQLEEVVNKPEIKAEVPTELPRSLSNLDSVNSATQESFREKQLLEAAMEQEAAKNGSDPLLRVKELRAFFIVSVWKIKYENTRIREHENKICENSS